MPRCVGRRWVWIQSKAVRVSWIGVGYLKNEGWFWEEEDDDDDDAGGDGDDGEIESV